MRMRMRPKPNKVVNMTSRPAYSKEMKVDLGGACCPRQTLEWDIIRHELLIQWILGRHEISNSRISHFGIWPGYHLPGSRSHKGTLSFPTNSRHDIKGRSLCMHLFHFSIFRILQRLRAKQPHILIETCCISFFKNVRLKKHCHR
jgi:hypothetical protein